MNIIITIIAYYVKRIKSKPSVKVFCLLKVFMLI